MPVKLNNSIRPNYTINNHLGGKLLDKQRFQYIYPKVDGKINEAISSFPNILNFNPPVIKTKPINTQPVPQIKSFPINNLSNYYSGNHVIFNTIEAFRANPTLNNEFVISPDPMLNDNFSNINFDLIKKGLDVSKQINQKLNFLRQERGGVSCDKCKETVINY